MVLVLVENWSFDVQFGKKIRFYKIQWFIEEIQQIVMDIIQV